MILSMARKATANRTVALEEARLRQQAIGAQLRRMFDDVVKEPIPAEFLDILRRADGGAADGD